MLPTDFSRFSAHATSYSWDNAIILAEASAFAYRDGAKIKAAVEKRWNIPSEHVEYLTAREDSNLIFSGRFDTQAFILKTDQVILLAFRGTEPNNRSDWKTDLHFRRRAIRLANSTKKVHVHEGFWRALDSIWQDIEAHLRKFRNANQAIWLTGHSLGGALACLTAFRLSQSPEFDFSGLYTYGQPRVGGWDFAKFFKAAHGEKIFRFVNNNDFVTFVPPFLFRYGHVGQLYYLTAKRKVVPNGLPFAKAVFDRIAGFRDFGQMDHSLETYLNILNENVKKI